MISERIWHATIFASMRVALLALLLAPTVNLAQDYVAPAHSPNGTGLQWNIGLGLGLDYGGFGAQVQCRPAPPLVMFAGGGYALAGFGYNVGAQGRILPDARWCPFVSAMYGYNAVIVVTGASQYDQVYYGPSFGLGVEMHRRDNAKNFWRFELLLPLRDKAFQEGLDALKKNPLIKVSSEPPPFGIGVGYHFGL
jgi:hypothetical protein